MVSACRGLGAQRATPGAPALCVHAQRNLHPVRGPPLGPLMRSVQPPVHAGDQAPREPALGPLRHSGVVRLRPGDPAPWGSRTRKHREAGCGRPEYGGVWTA